MAKKQAKGLTGKNRDMMPVPAEPMEKDYPQEHHIDDAVRTLERAEEIKADDKLMPHVHKKIGEKMKNLTSLKGMKKLAAKKSLEEQEAAE